jgi:hypothetical protein
VYLFVPTNFNNYKNDCTKKTSYSNVATFEIVRTSITDISIYKKKFKDKHHFPISHFKPRYLPSNGSIRSDLSIMYTYKQTVTAHRFLKLNNAYFCLFEFRKYCRIFATNHTSADDNNRIRKSFQLRGPNCLFRLLSIRRSHILVKYHRKSRYSRRRFSQTDAFAAVSPWR